MSKLTTAAIALLAVTAVGAGVFAGQQYWERAQAQSDLALARSQLAKAMGDLQGAKEQAIALRKEFDEQKLQADQMRADRDSARAVLEAEKARGERLVADLALLREQLAFKTRRSGGQYPAPVAVQPRRPMVIEATPAPRPQSATSPAR
jgi:hypothetical protein